MIEHGVVEDRTEDPVEVVAAHVAATTGLTSSVARRVVEDVFAHTAETTTAYLRRRHRELQAEGRANSEIFDRLAREVRERPFASPPLSERQIRRAIYG